MLASWADSGETDGGDQRGLYKICGTMPETSGQRCYKQLARQNVLIRRDTRGARL